MDRTRDSTAAKTFQIVLLFVDGNYEIKERILTIATADAGDAKTLTETVITEQTKAGLRMGKILSKVYNGASVMSGKHG